MLIDYKGHKIFAFSDTHGMYRRLSIPADTDILICAGDACEGFNPAVLKDFFAWFTSIPANFRIFVPGNHDRIFNQEPARARNLIPCGVVYLENEGLEFDGIKFYSVPARPYLKTPVTIPSSSPTARPIPTWTGTWAARISSYPLPAHARSTTSSATSTKKAYKERRCSAAPPFSMCLISRNSEGSLRECRRK